MRAAMRGDIAMSEAGLAELERKLASGKFTAALGHDDLDALMATVIDKITFFAHHAGVAMSRDPDDDKILHLAEFVGAAYLVTGDRDLLVLAPAYRRRGLHIVTPADFLAVPLA
jgi:uncharacterized protein